MRPRRISAFHGRRDPLAGPHLGLRLHGEMANVNVGDDFGEIEGQLGVLAPPLKDLVDIASATYVADLMTPARIPFYRDMEITVEVRDAAVWNDMSQLLGETVTFLLQAPISYRFVEETVPGGDSTCESVASFKSTVCLSGGLDSCVGSMTMAPGGSTLYVTHGSRLPCQEKVYEQVSSRNCRHLQVHIRQLPVLGKPKSYVQASRSFLYLALAGAGAIASGASEVLMFENGPLSIGLPFTSARFHTRTVHPVFLDRMQAIFRNLPSGSGISISNPFGGSTKAEVLKKTEPITLQSIVGETCSCSHASRVNAWRNRLGNSCFEGRHCGYCLPCILRRVSIQHSGIKDPTHYLVDILEEYPLKNRSQSFASEALANIRDLMVFCGFFTNEEDDVLYERFPNLYFETNRISPSAVMAMHRRFASQVLQVFREHGNSRLSADARKL